MKFFETINCFFKPTSTKVSMLIIDLIPYLDSQDVGIMRDYLDATIEARARHAVKDFIDGVAQDIKEKHNKELTNGCSNRR